MGIKFVIKYVFTMHSLNFERNNIVLYKKSTVNTEKIIPVEPVMSILNFDSGWGIEFS